MALKRLDRSKPPPGVLDCGRLNTYRYHVHATCRGVKSIDEAHDELERFAQPYIEDTLAQLVEWLREQGTLRNTGELADAIESGEWRR